jgi:acyl-CoA reductase-like NAD-dependent aldehyde dehydrogenase
MSIDSPVFQTTEPATGEVIETFPLMTAEEVGATVDRARIAAHWWAELGWDGRRARLLAWKSLLARRADQLAWLVHRENGKPVEDALLEIALSIEHLDWAAKNAEKVLGERGVRPSMLTINQKARLWYEPLGVVGVIGPWNYPVFTPVGSVGYALAAGNAVVFKPSEFTTAVGRWMVDSFAQVVPEQPVLQLVTGRGETGAALCTSGVDKISFTGSTATGKKVMAAAAQTLTPVVLELGGKDALIVDADANLDKAADAALFGAMGNAGQTCVAVERVYAHDSVYDAFLAKLAEHAAKLDPGSLPTSSYGPMTMPSQIAVVREHVQHALDCGGRAVVGGLDSIGESVIGPIVLADVPETCTAVTEETFGPVVIVNRVRDLDEGVNRANANTYGLGATLFGRDRTALMAAARRLRTGMVSINSWVMYAGVPALPWGGVGQSGFGRIHGADGLREFARSKGVVSERFASPLVLTSFNRRPDTGPLVSKALVALHGRRKWTS